MQIGQHVVCINDQWPTPRKDDRQIGVAYPSKGVVYTVRDVVPCPIGRSRACLLLREITNPVLGYTWRGKKFKAERSFRADWFRPLRKLTVEDFTNVGAPRETEPA